LASQSKKVVDITHTKKHILKKARFVSFYIIYYQLGTVYKRRLQSGGRGFVQCGQFSEKGEGPSYANVRTFWCKKLRIFQNFGVSTRTRRKGGWANTDILRTRGRGQFFAILCGSRLRTAPYETCRKILYHLICMLKSEYENENLLNCVKYLQNYPGFNKIIEKK